MDGAGTDAEQFDRLNAAAAAFGGGAPELSGRVPASFRDPSAQVFRWQSDVYRAVSGAHEPHHRLLMESGLYSSLVEAGVLISHEEADASVPCPPGFSRVIHPRQVPYISYAGEWCFSQLRDAASTTLSIQQRAIAGGMSLSDATSSNIQFLDGAPVWIDTSSLVRLRPEHPWSAYGQFCREFLGPLAVAARCHPDLQRATELWMGGCRSVSCRACCPGGPGFHPGCWCTSICMPGWSGGPPKSRDRS